MKTVAATLLATAAMIGVTQAAKQEDLDRYTACMISEAKASLKNDPGDQVAAYDRGARLCRVPYDATDEEVDGMGDYVELKITELAAQASETEELENCWSTAATAYLDRVGVSKQNLKEATQSADARCWTEMLKTAQEGREMREYMEVQLYSANPVPDTQAGTTTTVVAQSSEIDDAYQACWSGVALGYMDAHGTNPDNLVKAITKAGKDCEPQYERIAMARGFGAAMSVKEEIEIKFYKQYPDITAEQVKVAQTPQNITAALEIKPYELPRMKTHVGYNLMNQKTGFLCQFPSDVENARGLVETNRAHMVEQIGGCVTFDKPIEVEKIKSHYSAIEVRYVNEQGRMITAYTSDRTFRTWREWAEMSCRLAGNSDSACREDVKAKK